MKSFNFISNIIATYEKNHKPLDFKTTLQIENEVIKKPLIIYHGDTARVIYMNIYRNFIVLSIYKPIFEGRTKRDLFLIETNLGNNFHKLKFDDISYRNIFIHDYTFVYNKNYIIWEDSNNQKAAAFCIKNSIVKYYLVMDYKMVYYSEDSILSEEMIINKMKNDIPNVINNILAWNLLKSMRN
jgi:hypothetical protein